MIRRRPERGQGLVEFALVLPIFLLLLVAVFDLGHVVWANDTLSNAAREATRFAIVHGGSTSTPCPVGPPGVNATIPAASTSCPYPSPSKQAIKDVAINWAKSSATNVTVQVCYWDVTACTGDTDEAGATNDRGKKVTVTVSSRVSLAAPAFFGFGSISLHATTTMLVNH
jgi:hypothetical protein